MEITLKNFQKKIPIPRSKILKAVKKSRDRHHFSKSSIKVVSVPTFLSIVFVGEKRMRAINKKYLGHDYVTDVLTFDLGEGCAEIIICPSVARSNAKEHQTSTENEIILYVIHGILHLAGYDDKSEKDILRMRKMERLLTST
jgi:probable rRNA maturation factor